MANKGTRLYVCRDCGASRLVHWKERNRASPPRCYACGGLLEPKSDGAKADEHVGDLNVREHDSSRSGVIPAKGGRRTGRLRP